MLADSSNLEVVTNADATRKLSLCGIKRRPSAYFVAGTSLYVMIVVAAAGLLAELHLHPESKDLIQTLLTIMIALVGIQQWRSAKTEASLDKFYDRLSLTNERLRVWTNPRLFISDSWSEEEAFQLEMYVCLEVDNLEYVIEKYQRGYMEPRDAYREFTCFTSRCRAGEFKSVAIRVAARGGYKVDTLNALHRICRVCKQERCNGRDAFQDYLARVP